MTSPINLQVFAGRLGYEVKNPALLKQALTHRSAGVANNERLEFLGDAVLDLLIGEELYLRFPHATEGELTRLRSSLVREKTLAKLAKELDFGSFLLLGGGEMKTGGNRRESILADALEAVLGAIYLESGIDVCRQRIRSWFESLLEALTLEVDEKDAKTRLQELMQSKALPLPDYDVIFTEGEHHNQTLTVSCRIAGVSTPFIAKGSSRKKAEKKTAQLALAYLMDNAHQ